MKEIKIKPEDRILEIINIANEQMLKIINITIPKNIKQDIIDNSCLDPKVNKCTLDVKQIFGIEVKDGDKLSITLEIP